MDSEDIQPPYDILTAVKPSPRLCVTDFLQIPTPRRPGSRKFNLEAKLWYTYNKPNSIPSSVHDRHAVDILEPSVELREKLRQLEHFKMNLIETATAVLKEASSKPKRATGDITGEASDLPTAKRQAR
ncbi:hypothetical protein PHLCEN_2v8964 [Hermanssonia centrifuga]|uniref:Uncharacterized protein n=1 Tax=Hermanssonia centrifuga TaxID=98765 RepID=A0A2R6NS30_9APHY|nr:hypothetical protein PHLCEN_2v8964 [Hermanssonia centrifuga]